MTALLPIVEELADCQTDAERADWLLRVPAGVICRDSSSIRRILMEARFLFGLQAFEVEYAAIHATRLANGGLPPLLLRGVRAVRRRLRRIVRKGGAR
jgi:hypothetical protein